MSHILQDQVLQARIGRNLLVFQQVEAMLKKVAPFLVTTGESSDVKRVRALKAKIKRAPFGSVLDMLVKVSEIAPEFRTELRSIAKDRNDLVHRLLISPEAGLLHDDRRRAVAYLDEKYAAATRFREVVFAAYESVEDALHKGETMRIVYQVFDEA